MTRLEQTHFVLDYVACLFKIVRGKFFELVWAGVGFRFWALIGYCNLNGIWASSRLSYWAFDGFWAFWGCGLGLFLLGCSID